MLVLVTGTNLPTPLYRGYEATFGFSPLVVTLIFAAYVGALIPSLLITGSLSDAIGRRRVLLPAMVLAALGSLAFALADSIAWLFAARLLQGVAVGIASGALTAALSELEPNGNRRRAALVATASSLGGLGLGPLLAGVLAQYAPAPYVLPFALEIVLLVPAAAAMASLPDKRDATRWRPRRPSIPPAVRDAFLVSGTANFIAFSVIGLFLCLVPAYVVRLSGSTNLVVAGGAVTLMLACSIAAQVIAYRRNPIRQQIAGMVMLSIGLCLLAAAGSASSIVLLLIASVIGGLGHGMAFLGGLTEVNRLAPPDRHADVLSSFYVVVYLGVGVPVIGTGFLAAAFGLLPAVEVFAALVVPLCLIDLLLLSRRRQSRARSPV
jgi:MFS family permease